MSDDWKVGDLAVCVDTAPCGCGCVNAALRDGATFTVSEVIYDDRATTGVALNFLGTSPGHHAGFSAVRFRKIRPDEHEACEEEFRILLQLSKKRVSA